MNEVTYDWDMYIHMLDQLMSKLVQKLKKEAYIMNNGNKSDLMD